MVILSTYSVEDLWSLLTTHPRSQNRFRKGALNEAQPGESVIMLQEEANGGGKVIPFPGGPTLNQKIEQLEKVEIQRALYETRGNVVRAARKLGISRGSLRYKLEKYRMLELAQSPTAA